MKKRSENGKTESTAVDNEFLPLHSSLCLSLCAGLNCIAFLHRPPFALRRNKCTCSSCKRARPKRHNIGLSLPPPPPSRQQHPSMLPSPPPPGPFSFASPLSGTNHLMQCLLLSSEGEEAQASFFPHPLLLPPPDLQDKAPLTHNTTTAAVSSPGLAVQYIYCAV